MAALSEARRLVVKIGSALLVDRASGDLRGDWLKSLSADVARIKRRGADVAARTDLRTRVTGWQKATLLLALCSAFAPGVHADEGVEDTAPPGGRGNAQVAQALNDSPVVFRSSFQKALSHVCALSFPISLGLFAVAPDLVRSIYSPEFESAIPVVEVLAFYGLLLSAGAVCGPLLKAVGRPQVLLYTSVVHHAILFPALFLLARWGVVGIALAVLLPLCVSTAIGFGSLAFSHVRVIAGFGRTFAFAVGLAFLAVILAAPLLSRLMLRGEVGTPEEAPWHRIRAGSERAIRSILANARTWSVLGILVSLGASLLCLRLGYREGERYFVQLDGLEEQHGSGLDRVRLGFREVHFDEEV